MNCSQWYFPVQYFETLCRHIICLTHSRCGMYKIKCRNVLNQFEFLKTDICFRHTTAHQNELNLLSHPLILKVDQLSSFNSFIAQMSEKRVHRKGQFRTACKNFTTKMRTEPIL